MTLTKTLFALSFLGIFLLGCANAPTEMAMDEAAFAPRAAPEIMEEAPVEAEAADGAFQDDVNFGTSLAVAQESGQERLIIRTGDMSIIVTDTESAMNTIAQMTEENGGWVVSSNVFQYSEEAMTGNMSVRIPSKGFDSFLEAVRQMSVEVTRITTSGQDVTEEYVDLSARLENLEATADRVRSFLDEAKTVEEALEVSRELSRLEGEIESMKGRLQYLQQSASFSSVNIDLTPDVLAQPLEVGGWQPQGVVRKSLESLIAALQTLVDAAIWFVIFVLPLALIIAVPVWLIIRFFRRRRANRVVETSGEIPANSEE